MVSRKTSASRRCSKAARQGCAFPARAQLARELRPERGGRRRRAHRGATEFASGRGARRGGGRPAAAGPRGPRGGEISHRSSILVSPPSETRTWNRVPADGPASARRRPPRRSGSLGGGTARPPPRRGPRGRAGSTLGSTRRVAGTTSEDLRSEGYTDRGRGTYSSWPRRATSRLSFCARPKRLSSARKPPSSLRPSSVGASSSAWRRTRSPDRGGRSRRPPRGRAPSRGLRRSGGPEHLVDVVQRLDFSLQALDLTLAVGDCLCYDTHKFSQGLYRPSLAALWAPAPGAFQWVAILDTRTPMALRSPGVRVCGAG